MSEQQAEQSSTETGSLGAGSEASSSVDAKDTPVIASAPETGVESPTIAPDHEAPKPDLPRMTMPKAEPFRVEPAKPDTAGSAEPDAPRMPGKLMIMSPGERAWHGEEAASSKAEPSSGSSGKRRFGAMAAVVALATVAGAIGGALATSGVEHYFGGNAAASNNSALETSVARIDADVLALKISVEHTAKMGMSQYNKTSDRLDKLEKAQAEPNAKLAKLSEAVDKLRVQPAAAPVVAAATPAAAKEVTGSVTPPAATATLSTPQAAAAAAPKAEIGRLPTIDGWVLRDVGYGGALIESRRGTYEVYAGDMIPGLGRIDAVRRQDGHWVVVTSKGLIVAR